MMFPHFTNVPLEETIQILADKAFANNWFNERHQLNLSRMDLVDLHWMSPLVKSMLKTKAKVSISNTERLQHLNRRISQLISENRTHLLAYPIGGQKWWREVDSRSQRRTAAGSVALGSERLEQLNDYFGSLCTDDSYIKPLPVTIDDSVQVPEISELQVWQS